MTLLTSPPYRQSLLAAFDSCPRRALYALLDARRTPSGSAAGGTLVHQALHKGIYEMMAASERTISTEQIMEIYAEVLAQRDVPSDQVVPVTMKIMRRGRAALIKWALTMEISIDRVVGAEMRLHADVVLPGGEVVPITGQMDLLLFDQPNGAVILDYKSGMARPKQPRDEEKADDGRGLTELGWVQSLVYAYLVFENYNAVEYVIFREWHMLWGEAREVRIERFEMERLRDVLAAQVSLLHQAIGEGEDSPRWVPSAGPHCALCAMPRHCPIRKQVGIPTDEAEARRLAQEWIVGAKVREERIPLLKGWVEEHGPVEVPHSRGRRYVGWDTAPDGKRSFGIFEPKTPIESSFDEALLEVVREAGVLSDTTKGDP